MSDQPPEGFHHEWHVDEQWTTDPAIVDGRLCRFTVGPGHKTCREPAVAALDRSSSVSSSRSPRWWRYCEDHLYGRRLRDGRVEVRRLVRDDITHGGPPPYSAEHAPDPEDVHGP
jgi:hypothetical protein